MAWDNIQLNLPWKREIEKTDIYSVCSKHEGIVLSKILGVIIKLGKYLNCFFVVFWYLAIHMRLS